MVSKIKLTFISICLAASSFAKVDSTFQANEIFVEAGGMGGFYSFNFQRNEKFSDHWGINWSVGFSPQGTWGFVDKAYEPQIPLRLNLIYKITERQSIDLGIGIKPYNGNGVAGYVNDDYNLTAHALVRYRYYLKRYYLSIAFTPYIFDTYQFAFHPWGGLLFGYDFNKIEKLKKVDKEINAKTRNVSLMFGPLLPKFRFQYEKSYGVKFSLGVNLSTFLFHHEYAGSRIDVFGRYYFKYLNKMAGIFLQTKFAIGYQYSGLNIKFAEVPTFGFSYGAGAAVGYKFFIGNHLNLESILGAHYLTPPFVRGISEGQIEEKKTWWYSLAGFPLDLQFKIGWQF